MKKIEDEKALELFYAVLKIRLVEEAIISHYPKQNMRCPVHLSIGQEAVAVGVCKAALHTDYVLGNHRSHAHYLAKGGDLFSMIAEIHGKKTGCCSGRGGSMHLIDLEANFLASTPIVGGTIPLAVGVAFSQKLRKKEGATLVFFGEGATEEGVFSESLNFASLQDLPILFICENNFYSVYSPLSVRQSPTRSRIKIAEAHGIKTFFSDEGNEVEEVFSLAKEAFSFLRKEKKPVYIEFTTYRVKEHCGMYEDDHLGYRPEEEVAFFKQRCPLKKQEIRLKERGIWDEKSFLEEKKKIEEEIEKAFVEAEKAPYPSFEEVLL